MSAPSRARATGRRPRAADRAAAALLAALLGLAAAAAGVLRPAPVQGQDLVADLSDHLIAITTGFTGTSVVLFGAVDGPGDIAVVVRGPTRDVVVRRKHRTLGIWINTESMTFDDVPSFYRVASNQPLEHFASPVMLERHGIGLDWLRLTPRDAGDAEPDKIARFREALIRNKQREGVYSVEPGQVAFLGGRLFRTNVYFPANLPTGQYTVSVYLFRGGEVVSAQTTPLVVSKIGIGAAIFAFAQRDAAAYGLIAIVVAVSAGWLASALFRRA